MVKPAGLDGAEQSPSGYISKRSIYNLIYVHTCLSSILNDSSSSHHCSLTRHAKTTLKDDSESVTLAEVNGVKILQDIYVKEKFII